MDDNEVNRVIAEYMGDPCGNCYEYGCTTCRDSIGFQSDILYTKSLDALVPVWEKLDCCIDILPQGNGYSCILDNTNSSSDGHGDTIQQAAAHATAKAIKELSNE